tara:strand:- start:239 stop:445 length:207 start_codon:yes stop_codon:yes gene_type:complete
MKLTLNLSILLFSLFMFDEKLFSLSNYQLKKICKKERNELTCKKNWQERQFNLQKGNLIEIPVIPYKR